MTAIDRIHDPLSVSSTTAVGDNPSPLDPQNFALQILGEAGSLYLAAKEEADGSYDYLPFWQKLLSAFNAEMAYDGAHPGSTYLPLPVDNFLQALADGPAINPDSAPFLNAFSGWMANFGGSGLSAYDYFAKDLNNKADPLPGSPGAYTADDMNVCSGLVMFLGTLSDLGYTDADGCFISRDPHNPLANLFGSHFPDMVMAALYTESDGDPTKFQTALDAMKKLLPYDPDGTSAFNDFCSTIQGETTAEWDSAQANAACQGFQDAYNKQFRS